MPVGELSRRTRREAGILANLAKTPTEGLTCLLDT